MSAQLDAAFDALAEAIDDVTDFRANSDDWINSRLRAHPTSEIAGHVESALLSNRDHALKRVLELQESS